MHPPVHTTTHPSPASDLVTCALFSPLATHLALASADHHIRITTHHPESNTWDHDPREWKAHDGPVLTLAWAHPSFGNLLASGGSDGALHLWLEDPDQPHQHHPQQQQHHQQNHHRAPTGWSCTASLLDAHGTLRSISFAPPDHGLKLAAVSSDSHLRVWECLDPLALRDWQLTEDVDLGALPLTPSTGTSAGLYSSHHPDPRSAALGSGDGFGLGGGGGGGSGAAGGAGPSGSGATLGGGGSGANGTGLGSVSGGTSTGSSAGPFPSVSSASSVSGTGGAGTGTQGGGGGARAGGTVESDGAWAVSWCQEAWWGERIAATSGTNGIIRLFHFPSSSSSSSSSGPWHNFLNLLPSRPYISSTASSSGAGSAHSASPTPTSSAFSLAGAGAALASSSGDDHDSHGAHFPGSGTGTGGAHQTHTPPTASLAWAPPSGRSFLLLAAGARDGRARVWKVVPPPLGGGGGGIGAAGAMGAGPGGGTAAAGGVGGEVRGVGSDEGEWAARLEVELDAAPLAERAGLGGSATGGSSSGGGGGGGGAAGATLWGGPGGTMASARVAWNVTGTVLSTSGGDDGRVRLWKPTYTGQWRQLAVLGTEEAPGPSLPAGAG